MHARICTHTHSDDLLTLFDGPLSTPPQQPALTSNASTLIHMTPPSQPKSGATLPPQVSTDLSLLDPTPSSLQAQLAAPEKQGSLALTLFENPVGSLRVPTELQSFPVSSGWEQKVRVCVDIRMCVYVCVCIHACMSVSACVYMCVCTNITMQYSPMY